MLHGSVKTASTARASAKIAEAQPEKEEKMIECTTSLENRMAFVRGQMEYWSQVAESDGFDIENITAPERTAGLFPYDCKLPRFRFRSCVVKLYARAGLHRYNMLNGTNFQLSDLPKYNKTMNCVSSFYITLEAEDISSQLKKHFQVRVDEKSYGKLDMTVSIARIKDEEKARSTNEHFTHHFYCEADGDDFYQGDKLPDWPSLAGMNNPKRFYLVNNSEFLANDWIHLYLELAVGIKERKTSESQLSQLQILKVAIETKENVQPPSGRLKAKSALFYITFTGLAKAPIGEIGEHVERRVIVRRVIDDHGYLTFRGGFSIGEESLKTDQPVTLPSGEEALDDEQSSTKRRCLDQVIS